MQKSGGGEQFQNVGSPWQSFHCSGSKREQKAAGQQVSKAVFPEKRGKVKSQRKSALKSADENPEKLKPQEHRIDVADEQADLLGYVVYSGKLALDKGSKSVSADDQTGLPDAVDAKLTSKALVWGSHMLGLEDVVSVSYNAGVRHFTVHSYPVARRSCIVSCFLKPRRTQKDFRFLASSAEEAIQWIRGFAVQQCFINCLPHPMVSNKKQASDLAVGDALFDLPYIKCKTPPKVLVILNPRSGHGRSSKVFYGKVEPIFKEHIMEHISQ